MLELLGVGLILILINDLSANGALVLLVVSFQPPLQTLSVKQVLFRALQGCHHVVWGLFRKLFHTNRALWRCILEQIFFVIDAQQALHQLLGFSGLSCSFAVVFPKDIGYKRNHHR